MSDGDDKIARVTDLVTPAEDFGERVASAIEEAGARESQESLWTQGDAERCPWKAGGKRCSLDADHDGPHSDKSRLNAVAKNYLSSADILRFANAPDYTRKQPLQPKRPWTVSIGTSASGAILPGRVETFTAAMQIVFRAKQIVCAPLGGKLYINGVFVGQRVQMMQWGESGMLMDFLKERTDVDFDTAEPGVFITIQVINRGDTPGTFDITLFGEAVIP